jgi:hypothetical protein
MTERLQDAGRPFDPQSGPLRLVLASGSASRARMLAAAGVDFIQNPADIDEAALMPQGADAGASALALAGLKPCSPGWLAPRTASYRRRCWRGTARSCGGMSAKAA